MNELKLFSDQAPPDGATGGAARAAGHRTLRHDAPKRPESSAKRRPLAPTSPGTATGAPGRGQPTGAPEVGSYDAQVVTTDKPGYGESSTPKRRPLAPTSPGTATDEPSCGEPTSERLLGLLDALVGGLRGLGGVRVEECLRLVGRCEARLAAVKAHKVAELAQWRGEAHAADVLRGDLKQSRGGARREVQFAGRLADLPGTAEALATGAITPQAARAIADSSAHSPINEDDLLDAAENEPADVFARTVRDHVNDRSTEVDLEERRRRQRARREANIRKESDGMYKLFGTFDPVAGARIETALAAMANRLRRNEDLKDRATPAQRQADALEALITRRDAGAGTVKAQRTNLLVIADYDLLAGRLANARLIDGTPLTPGELLRLALDANILPALFDTKGQPLWLGHKYRNASVGQRIALAARDGGCVVCDAANSFCHAHHLMFWEDGGPTDIDNLALLCVGCHKAVHEGRAQLARGPDGGFTLEPPSNRLSPTPRNGSEGGHNSRIHGAERDRPAPRTSANGKADSSEAINPTLRC